jgi:hypothetical protein
MPQGLLQHWKIAVSKPDLAMVVISYVVYTPAYPTIPISACLIASLVTEPSSSVTVTLWTCVPPSS